MEKAVESVLNQEYENLEMVICDNASTDGTEEWCRDLAARDSRVVYHRQPENVGLHNNFLHALRLATGTFYRWMGDDDWLDPRCVSRSLDAFASDDRLLLVTTQTSYVGADGVERTDPYDGTALGSDDAATRFAEMLRLQNESAILVDPLYAVIRREPILTIERRNMLNEDQVFAAKLALAGPWGHISEVLTRRHSTHERRPMLARKLGLPPWQAHFGTALQCKELLGWLDESSLDEQQRRRAKLAVARLYLRRQQNTATHRGRKLLGIARALPMHGPTRSALISRVAKSL
jgi:glycosyltransferase involved in cell wall biosynthesis